MYFYSDLLIELENTGDEQLTNVKVRLSVWAI